MSITTLCIFLAWFACGAVISIHYYLKARAENNRTELNLAVDLFLVLVSTAAGPINLLIIVIAKILNRRAGGTGGEAGRRSRDATRYQGGDHCRCDTDGHYLCSECTHLSQGEQRRRKGQCEDCGASVGDNDECAACAG